MGSARAVKTGMSHPGSAGDTLVEIFHPGSPEGRVAPENYSRSIPGVGGGEAYSYSKMCSVHSLDIATLF